MKTSRIRKTLIMSFTLILVCLISFTMTTFAWFSDSVSSSNNIITVGNLDAEMYWTDNLKTDNWYNIEDSRYNAVFTHDNYEPGYTDVKYIKIVNKGTLSFKYDLKLLALGTIGELADVVDIYTLPNATSNISSRKLSEMNKLGTIKDNIGNTLSGVGSLLHNGEIVVAIALQMQKDAGNEYQGKSIGDGFSIQLVATQYNDESDSFGSDYDKNATFPVNVSTGVSTQNGLVTKEATMKAGLVEATIPAGVKVNEGKNILTLSVTEMEETGSNITVTDDEVATSLDVHIEGVSSDNTVPMIITIRSVAGKYLNKGNLDLYHVENGVTHKMEQVDSLNALDKHNEFYYDAQSGALVLALASFSEIRSVQDLKNTWNGNYDHSWYTNKPEGQDYYTIYNADQLAGLSAIVGGMNGFAEDTFAGKTIKLVADINIADTTDENDYVFYPIGYYNNKGDYTKSNVSGVVSGLKYFKGTFDGNGHTIANFYQNTWEMFGDYNSGYAANSNHYRDGMGLFGKVKDATIKNLHIDNFSCDSEFGISGIVATYANNSTFQNIAITNCTPGVYNNANGGIVGYVGYGYSDSYLNGEGDYKDSNDTVTFENITVDNTNTIRALWGTYDGCCAGILGRYDSDSKIVMNNCHVAAKMDVFNDVCGNYQYYWYRYSAMLAGSIEVMTKDENGYIIPDLTNFYIESTTVHYGEWNDMYYCELVENTLASYTHDHQFSRLTKISSDKEIKDSDGNWIKTGDFIIVDETQRDNPDAHTCFHIRKDENGNLYRHIHEDYNKDGIEDYQTINGKPVLVEDKQCIYLPFDQLFQGWGYGAKNIPLNGEYKEGNIYVSSLDKIYNNGGSPIEKFVPKQNQVKYYAGQEFKLGDLFVAKNKDDDMISRIHPESISVAITYVDENGYAMSAEAEINVNTSDWTQSTIKLPSDISGEGYITIQDYVYCQPATVILHVHNSDDIQYDDKYHWTGCSCAEGGVLKVEHSFVKIDSYAKDYLTYKCSGCEYSYTTTEVYNVTVNHLYIDGSVASPRETISSTEVIKAKTIENHVPSLKEVKVDTSKGQNVVNIYYSEVDEWDGVAVSTVLQGEGTEKNPYLIQSGADLAYLANQFDSFAAGGEYLKGEYFKLTKSIDLNNNPIKIGDYVYENWGVRKTFAGVFDGNNCTILGITTALFGGLGDSGSVKNLSVYGTINESTVYAAAIAAYNSGTINNCYNYVNITASGVYAGGIVGYNEHERGKIINCVNYGTVTTAGNRAGGIAGENKYLVEGCVNYGSISGSSDVGGIVGYGAITTGKILGSVISCSNYGSVSGSTKVGGIVGNNIIPSGREEGSITSCINYGSVCATRNVGGIVGETVDKVTESKNFGYISAKNDNAGGIVGYSNNAATTATVIVENCSNYGFVSGYWASGAVVGLTYSSIISCINYGTLKGNTTHIGGIVGDIHNVTNVRDELNIKDCINYGNIIKGSWGVGGIAGDSVGVIFTNCKNYGAIYNVEGQIGGITGKSNNDVYDKCENHGAITATTDSVGGIVGDQYDQDKIYQAIRICDSSNYGTIHGQDNIGGIVGVLQYGTIESCKNYGTVIGDESYVGGLAGVLYANATLNGSSNEGNVTGLDSVGGIVGLLEGIVTNCHNSGEVVATNKNTTLIGGVVGQTRGDGNEDGCSNSAHVYVNKYNYVDNIHYNTCMEHSDCELNRHEHTISGTTCTVCGYSYSQSVNVVVDGKVYLTPNANWKQSNARFVVYTWATSKEAKWINMTDTNGDGVYEAMLPEGYVDFKFCRMDPNNLSNSFNNPPCWNESANFKYDGTNNHFILKSGAWTGADATKSTYKESHSVDLKMYSYTENYAPNKVYLKPNNDWKSNGARFAVWAWSGSTSGTWFDMTDADKDGIFEVILPEQYDMVIFYRMDPSKPNNNFDHTDQGGSMWNKTGDILLNDRTSNLFVIDSWSGGYWQSVVEETASYRLQQGSSENTLESELYLESDTYYSFKLNEGSTWYGNKGLIESETATPWVFETDGSTPNCRFIAEQTGYYRFIYNYGKKQVSVEFIGTSYSN